MQYYILCEIITYIFYFTRQYSERPPSVIVASIGLQLIRNRNTTEQALEEYKRNLTQLVQPVDALAERGTHVLWKILESIDSTKINSDFKISNNDIDAYNRAAVEVKYCVLFSILIF